MKESLDDMVDYPGFNQYYTQSREVSPTELHELVAGDGKIAVAIPNFLIRELIDLQRETNLGIGEMLVIAIRQFVDREKSSGEHVGVDAVKYSIP